MKLLIVVDMQNDFIDGTLGSKDAEAIVPEVCSTIREYGDKGYLIVTTYDTHQDNYLETQEGRKLPIPHCIADTPGWELNKDVRSVLSNYNFMSVRKECFGSMQLPRIFKQPNITEIVFIGLCTDICVISNAVIMKSALPEAIIKVKANACAGVTPQSHQTALDAMKALQIEII